MKFVLVALLALFPSAAAAQITIPFSNFVPGQVIASGEANSNFSILSDQALNRSGGTITGHITLDANVTIDGIDVSDFFGGSGQVWANTQGSVAAVAFGPSDEANTGLYTGSGTISLALAGTERFLLNASGLTVFGTNILASNGKVPGINSTYFASLDGGAVEIAESGIVDGSLLARVGANETIAGAWDFDSQLSVAATWNAAGVVFRALDINVTNTASNAASKLIDWHVASVDVAGKFVPAALQVTEGAIDGAILLADANGVGQWTDLSNAVPSGMLAFFEAACPTGWTRRALYDGNFIRGGATFDSVGGGSNAAHTHTVDPPSTGSDSQGSHSHSVDFASTLTSSAGSHDHAWGGSDTGSMTSAGNHSHTYSISVTSGTGASQSVQSGAGVTVSSADHTHTLNSTPPTASTGSHTHTLPGQLTASSGSHTHSFDLPSTATTTTGAHTHSVDVASFSSDGTATVPAYIDAVVCKKD